MTPYELVIDKKIKNKKIKKIKKIKIKIGIKIEIIYFVTYQLFWVEEVLL